MFDIKQWTHAHTRTVIGAAIGLGLLIVLVVHEARNKSLDLADLKTYIAQRETESAKASAKAQADLAAANARIQALEQQRKDLVSQPAQAPVIIRETIPTSTPIQQTQAVTKDTPPDAPVAVLTKQNEVDLANFGLTCRECQERSGALQSEVQAKDQKIQDLTKERDKAVETAKGGSAWKRAFYVVKLSACGGLGAGAGSTVKKPGSAAIGAALGVVTCALASRH